jgi:purine-binding chemotaxis protein CheW
MVLVFSVAGTRFALPLAAVEKVEMSAEVTILPDAPAIILGALDWRGTVLPLVGMRKRLHLEERAMATSDRIIIVAGKARRFALLVDGVAGVLADRREGGEAIGVPDGSLNCVAGALRTEEGIVLVLDPESLPGDDGQAGKDLP